MTVPNDNPLIVQSDRTILAEAASLRYPAARDLLCRFAELVKSPEHVHTYRLTNLSLWNAAASGMSSQEIAQTLVEYARYPVPSHILSEIDQTLERYGRVRLLPGDERARLRVEIDDPDLAERAGREPRLSSLLERLAQGEFLVWARDRGRFKQALIQLGYPVVDLAGYTSGASCAIALRPVARSGAAFTLRAYQQEAVERFYQGGSAKGGSGVIVLPCGSGKTVVGLAAMARLQCQTLIITTSVAAVHQWIREILDKTELAPDSVGEYTAQRKSIRPVTVTTYQILIYSRDQREEFEHFQLFNAADWGLIIYDEVHLVPAPLFRITAEIQARRRLGLTATLVREDGHEDEVFSLIGPKRHDVPWKVLEADGWIATALCHELRVPLAEPDRLPYAMAEPKAKFRIASENPLKLRVVERLLEHHQGEPALIIGQYLDQLQSLARSLELPLITGQTPHAKREALYAAFQAGRLPVLVVSKVANFSIDLPDARVLIQVSGTFGSRQEEAQRLGRILRPKPGAPLAHFYSLVTSDTVEREFAHHRQLFLTEQGYRYEIEPLDCALGAVLQPSDQQRSGARACLA